MGSNEESSVGADYIHILLVDQLIHLLTQTESDCEIIAYLVTCT